MSCPEFLQKLDLCTDAKNNGDSAPTRLWEDTQKEMGKALRQTGQELEESNQEQNVRRLDDLMRETESTLREGGRKNIDSRELKKGLQEAGKGIEKAFNWGIERLTKVDAAELERSFKNSQAKLDLDKDGFVTQEELEKASENPFFRLTNAHMLRLLKSHYDVLQTLSNDEWGFENSGITVKDIEAARALADSGPEFSTSIDAAAGSALSFETLTTAGLLSAGGAAATLGSKVIFGAATRVPLVVGLGLAAGAIGLSGGYGALEHAFSRKAKLDALLSDLR